MSRIALLVKLLEMLGPTLKDVLPILIDLFKPAAGSPTPGFDASAALSAEGQQVVDLAVAQGADEDQARELAFYAQHAS